MSVKIVTPAQKYQKAKRFMHCPGTVMSQKRAMGMQASPVPTIPIVPLMQMKTSRAQQSVRTRPSRMKRRNCKMHDALIVVKPRLYMNMLAQNGCCCQLNIEMKTYQPTFIILVNSPGASEEKCWPSPCFFSGILSARNRNLAKTLTISNQRGQYDRRSDCNTCQDVVATSRSSNAQSANQSHCHKQAGERRKDAGFHDSLQSSLHTE